MEQYNPTSLIRKDAERQAAYRFLKDFLLQLNPQEFPVWPHWQLVQQTLRPAAVLTSL
jgi:hypothetical protein